MTATTANPDPPAARKPERNTPGPPPCGLRGCHREPGKAITFAGRAEEAARLRREIAAHLENCPAAADIILITHELAANAIMHTRSRGNTFTVSCQLSPQAARIEVEDLGGPWRPRSHGDRPHGLDIVQALTGPNGWGTHPTGTGGRIVWAELSW